MFDRLAIRQSFGRASEGYDAVAALQRWCEDALLDQLDFLKAPPRRILDLGAGTGRGTALLKARFPKAQVIALDLALPMLRAAGARRRWRRGFDRVCAQVEALPLAPGSIDLVWSSLCLQWSADLPATWAEIRRVLNPGGMLLLATLGRDTLKELRNSWAAADDRPHVHGFADLAFLGDSLLRAGFRDPVLERELQVRHHADARTLMRELKQLGAHNLHPERTRGLTGRHALARMTAAYEALRTPQGLPASWEIHFAHAFGPADGQPIRDPGRGGVEASFSVAGLLDRWRNRAR
jgi:malonyl-CoA O-methyltransferase